MSVKITDNTPKIQLTQQQQVGLFCRFILDEVEKHSDPITPKKEGQLRRSTLKSVSGNQYMRRGTIKWDKEYAAAQEVGTTRGYPIKNYTTPGTGKNYALRGAQRAVQNAHGVMRKAGLL